MSDNQILERLDTLIMLSIIKFEETNYDVKGLQLEILNLCDYEHTVSDIMKKLSKPRQSIDDALSKLRNKGLIKSTIKDTLTVYVRIK